jgi:hypothetical protein
MAWFGFCRKPSTLKIKFIHLGSMIKNRCSSLNVEIGDSMLLKKCHMTLYKSFHLELKYLNDAGTHRVHYVSKSMMSMIVLTYLQDVDM